MGIISMNSATNHHFSNRAKNYSLLASLAFSATALLFSNNFAYAEASTSSSANASVTVSDTIRLTLSGGDLVINNLTPGTSADSNIITATVTSNSPYGFHLSATTGTKNGTTSLVNTADSNFVFTNLDSNKASSSNFSDNTWGYSYSTNNGTSWVSGDYGTAQSGYNGLSLDNDDSGSTGTTLFNSDSYTNSAAVKFKIGAKSSQTQASGTYTGTVNFYAVTNPGPDNTMQGFAAGNASTTCTAMSTGDTLKLKDSRDNTEYTIGKLADDKCWLLDNLALDLVANKDGMNSSNTNIKAENEVAILKSLKEGNRSSGEQYATAGVTSWTSGYSHSAPLVKLNIKDMVPTDAISAGGNYKVGGFYNYCAASVGSYCYGDGTDYGVSSGNATSDICPKGWRMPGCSDAIDLVATPPTGEYRNLGNIITGTTTGSYTDNNYVSYRSVLHLPLSGYSHRGSAVYQGINAVFWSSSRYTDRHMYSLFSSTSEVNPANYNDRSDGRSVRCVLGS